MPVKVAVENRDELRFVVYRFTGHIAVSEVFGTVAAAAAQLTPGQLYHELLIFERDADLSEFDPKSLEMFHHKCDELYRELNLGNRTGAAVLDACVDAKIIMPLFNALSRAGRTADLSFELFTDVEPALKRLGISVEEGLKIIARTA